MGKVLKFPVQHRRRASSNREMALLQAEPMLDAAFRACADQMTRRLERALRKATVELATKTLTK